MNILRGEIMMEMKKRIDHCGVFFAGSIGRSSMIALLLCTFALAGLLMAGDAAAALQVKQGTVTKRTTSGATAVTGVGFQPKAIMFYWTKQITSNGTAAATISSGEGFAAFNGTAITMASTTVTALDAVTTSDVNGQHSSTYAIVSLQNTANITAIASYATVTSMDADGFTLNWTVTTAGTADIIHYVALGGTDLTNANVGTTSMFALTGNSSVTGVGFQPDAVLLLANCRTTVLNAVPAASASPAINRGFMVGGASPSQGSIGWGARDAQTVAAHGSAFSATRALNIVRRNLVDVAATYVSMDVDGFTMNASATGGATNVSWLALKGGQYKVAAFAQPTAGTPPFTTPYTGVGFTPTGLILASTSSATADNTVDTVGTAGGASFALGAASATTARGSIWAHYTGTTVDANMNNDNTKVIRLAYSNGTTVTNAAVADLSSLNADGFTLNWTTRADAVARRVLYFAMGSAVVSTVTTLADGTNPGNSTLAPGATASNLDAFTLTGTVATTVPTATVTLAPANAFANIALVELTNAAGDVVYGSVANPASNTVNFSGMSLPVTTSTVTFYVRITPKAHAAMPGVATGASYATTGTVTAFTTALGTTQGTDTGSATLTIDNASPANPTLFVGTAGNNQVALTWTNPGVDFNSVVILRKTSAIADVPVEGTTYVATNTIGTSTVVYAGPLALFTDTVVNGTGYFYKIFAKDAYGNYSSGGMAAGPYTPTGPTTTIGNGTAPPNLYLAPGAAVNDLDYFTVQTSTGTETISSVTLALSGGGGAPNAYSGIGQITITNTANTVLGTLNNPVSDTPTIVLTTNITASTTSTQYKVRITPKTHVNMPAPPGALYTISGTVSAVTSTNTKVYSDTSSCVIEIDNASTDVATWGVITPGNTQIDLSWANPADPDLDGTNSVVVLRKGGSAVTEIPVEGQSYIVGNTIGTATVRYVGPVEGFIDTSLTNFVDYYYAIFAKDTNGNYSLGSTTGPHQPWIPVCVPNTPTLTINPGARNAIPTDIAKYTISVKNNDNALCTAQDFTLGLGDSNSTDFVTPSVLSATVLNIAPGATKQSTLTVTVNGLAPLGNINVTTINVTAAGHSSPPAVTATTTAANPLMHNSRVTGSTKWAGQGGWGVTGGKYGTFNCYICHENSVFGANGTPNVKKVRTTIEMPADAPGGDNWPTGGKITPTITFDDTRAGSSSYADSNSAHTTSTRVCEVCHTYQGGGEPNDSGVRNHAYNMSAATPQEQAHNSLGDCLSCHPHQGGFKAQGCTACHGNPLTIPAHLSISPVTGSSSIGAHPKHQTESFNCDYCHGIGSTGAGGGALHNQGAIYIEFSGFGQAEGSDGTYKGAIVANRPFGYLGNDLGTADGSLSCATTYCHGGTMYPALPAPTWTGTAVCGSCHNDMPADTGWLGSHADHVSATGANLGCNVCHGAGYTAGTTKPVGHLNGQVKIDLGAYGSYTKVANGGQVPTVGLPTATAYGNCTVTCHGAAQTPVWGTDFGSVPAKCTKCHNDGTAGALLINAVPSATKNAHVAHINANNSYVTNDCAACHGANAQIGTHTGHANGSATYGNQLSGYSTTNKNCTNTCHVSSTTNLWIATPPALACADCHSSTYIGGNNVAMGFNAIPTSGLHNMTAAGVQKHDATISGGCAACHQNEDVTNHLNGAFVADSLTNNDRWVNRTTGGVMTYTQITPASGNSGTCSGAGLTGCHSDNGNWYRRWSTEANVADSVTTVGNTKCNVCHGQWNTWAQGTTHYKTSNSAASTKGSGHDSPVDCAICHAYLHANYGARHDSATHRVTMNSNGTTYARNGAVYGTSKAGCSQCHGGATDASYNFDISYFTGETVVGDAPPMPACDSCHNNAGKVTTVPQVIIGTTANSSSSHVDADGAGAAKTINVVGATAKCEDCHAGHADNTSGVNDVEISTFSTALGTTVPTMNWSYSTHFNKIKLGGTSTSGSTEAEMCWNCHNTVGVSEWGTNTKAKTGNVAYHYGTLYSDLSGVPGTTTSNWTTGFWRSAKGLVSGSTLNPFWYKRGAIQSTHSVNFDSGVVTITTGNSLGFGRTETKDTVGNIRCSYCHDVHGTHNSDKQFGLASDTSGGTGTADSPYLRGTWTGNQYAEDGAPQWGMHTNWTAQGTTGTSTTFYGKVPRGSALATNSGLAGVAKAGAWWIDQNSNNPTGIVTTSTEAQRLAVANSTSGLCEQCHGTNKTGVWTTNSIGNINWSTNGVGEANNWISGYNGHANSVVGGPGRGANASAEARARNILTRVGRGTAAIIQGETSKGAVDMGVATETGTRGYSYRSSTGSGTGYLWFPRTSSATTNSGTGASTAYRTFAWATGLSGTSTRGSLWATGTVMLTMTTALTEATHDAQANYHTFTCAKCHNPHASRLPKLMITNCLDTNHNTWEDFNYTGAALPTIWTNTRHSQWASAITCHRLDARAPLTTGQVTTLGRGWNRVTPWMEFTNPNSTRATNPNP